MLLILKLPFLLPCYIPNGLGRTSTLLQLTQTLTNLLLITLKVLDLHLQLLAPFLHLTTIANTILKPMLELPQLCLHRAVGLLDIPNPLSTFLQIPQQHLLLTRQILQLLQQDPLLSLIPIHCFFKFSHPILQNLHG